MGWTKSLFILLIPALVSAADCPRQARAIAKPTRLASTYTGLPAFGRALPHLRESVAALLENPKELSQERAVAVAVRLIDLTAIRVGQKKSERQIQDDKENGREHYGLVALRAKHLRLSTRGGRFELRFVGKSGVDQAIEVNDVDVAQYFRESQALAGYELFKYVENGERRVLSDEMVRAFVSQATGGFTPKAFRTWHGTLAAATALAELGVPRDVKESDDNIAQAIQAARDKLGHEDGTTTAEDHYIHPLVLSTYRKDPQGFLKHFSNGSTKAGLTVEEARLLSFLARH